MALRVAMRGLEGDGSERMNRLWDQRSALF